MKPSKKLDIVLGIIAKVDEFIDSKSIYSEIPEEIKPKELTPIINKLVIDGYVEKKIIDDKSNSKLTPPYFCRITFSGLVFLQRGAYFQEERALILNKYWKKTKAIANLLNAILVLIIAAASVYVSIDSKKKDEIIEKKDNEIKSLKTEINKKT